MSSQRGRVLCVDDEPEVLRGLALNLGRHYEVLTAGSGAAALALLEHEPGVGVIISDMLMPGESGASFLAQARILAPEAQRIMLTGQVDVASAIAAVNHGQVFHFLTKPCPPPELLATVQAAMQRYESRSLDRTTQRRKVEHAQLRIDPLTGLGSRLQFLERLEFVAGAADVTARAVTAYFINIERADDAALVPEDAQGDVLPRVLAERLRSYCSGASALARWGIEQFAVLLPSHGVMDLDLFVWGQRLLEVLAEPIVLNHDRLSCHISIGIARLNDPLQWHGLMQCAGLAAQEARRGSEPRVCLYRPEVPLHAERERLLLRALRETLDAGGLHLHYQPIVDVKAGRVRALECLARWQHPSLGAIAPITFIALAEQHGDIGRLGEWVLKHALAEAAPLVRTGKPHLAINVSARQLMDKQFLPALAAHLADSALPPRTLELELTESALAGNMENLRDVLRQIRRLKVRVVVDDFGTGYSSLAYLSRLPIDVIKVDRIFVRDFNKGGKTIIKAALAIARDFDQDVVIEGVENAIMLQQVLDLGATLIQGYWFARPMPAAALDAWISEFEGRPTAGQEIATRHEERASQR